MGPGFDPLATHNMEMALQEGGAFFCLYFKNYFFNDAAFASSGVLDGVSFLLPLINLTSLALTYAL